MRQVLAGTALAVLLIGSGTALAATTPPPASSTPPDYAARCTSLAEQWKTAEAANASNAHLGKAKADAAKGEKLCSSKKATDHKKGVTDYEAALKLLGVTPT